MTKQKIKMTHHLSERATSKEIIHSGQFMVSEFEAEAQDEEDVSISFPVDGIDNSNNNTYSYNNITNPGICRPPPTISLGFSIDDSLTKLFHCMSLAYRQKLTSPKWNQFKGLKLRWKEKIRLNNIIWRAWHMQFILRYNSSVCQFASPLDVDMHTKPEAIILEGKYWKRRVEAVIAEYKKWRLFSKNQILGKYREFLLHEDCSPSDSNCFNNVESSNSFISPEDLFIDFNDTLFALIPSQPFQFPNPREIARGGSIADFIQPGLVQFQPDLNDCMDVDPIQELLASKLATVEEEECNMSELNSAMQLKPNNDTYKNSSDQLSSFSNRTNLMDVVPDSMSHSYDSDSSISSKVYCNSKPISSKTKFMDNKECVNTFDSMPTFCPDSLLPALESCVDIEVPIKTKFENDSSNILEDCSDNSDTKKSMNLYDNIAAFQSSRSLSLPANQDSAVRTLQPIPRRHSSSVLASKSSVFNASIDTMSGSNFSCDNADVSMSSTVGVVSHPNYYLYPINIESAEMDIVKGTSNIQSSSVENLPSKDDPLLSKNKSRIRSWSVSSIQNFNRSNQSALLSKCSFSSNQSLAGKSSVKDLFDSTSYTGSLTDIGSIIQTSQSAEDICITGMNHSKLFPSSPQAVSSMCNVEDSCHAASVDSNSLGSPVVSSVIVGVPHNNSVKQFRPKSVSERVQYKEHRRVCHINAEQKRRCNIKYGFDTLHNLVPSLSQSPGGKVSKAVMLQRASDYISILKSDRETLTSQIDCMKQQIESLNQAICACQSRLPATGAPVCRPRQGQITDLYSQYVRQRTTEDWKFWIFSSLFEPMLESFNNAVSTTNLEELCRSTLTWVDQHCSLVMLRPAVLNSLRQLSTTTSILTEPSRLPEEAVQAVNKEESTNNVV